MKQTEPYLKILGFANRAKKLSIGMSATLRALHYNKLRFVLLASDVSENTKNKLTGEAAKMKVPVRIKGTKAQLGAFFGRDEVGIVGIIDATFAKSMLKVMN